MASIKYNTPGRLRRALVWKISEYEGKEIHYLGPPTFAYQVGDVIIGRDGAVENATEELIAFLRSNDYIPENEPETESINMEISVPAETANVNILLEIIEAKSELIRSAFKTDSSAIRIENEKITFPWFSCEPGTDEAMAYMLFVTSLCRLSRQLKRVKMTEKDLPNEKYAFRCFLLRLGFIGDEYKAARKILLQNLDGSSAFKVTEGEA